VLPTIGMQTNSPCQVHPAQGPDRQVRTGECVMWLVQATPTTLQYVDCLDLCPPWQ
jgi:hypothetical protein